MSDEGRNHVKRHSPFTGTTFWFHYVLGDLANDQHDYEIYFGDKRFAAEWPFSLRAIARARKELVDAGFLTVIDDRSGPGRPIRYRFEFYIPEGNARQNGNRPTPAKSDTNTGQIGAQHTPKSGPPQLPNQIETEGNGTRVGPTALCRHLADRVGGYNGGKTPTVTGRWHRDMDLLLRRGSNRWDTPEPIDPERITRAIDFVFDHLADPEPGSGFCWAANIRSPGALRDHWDQIRDAARRLSAARRPRQSAQEAAASRILDDLGVAR